MRIHKRRERVLRCIALLSGWFKQLTILGRCQRTDGEHTGSWSLITWAFRRSVYSLQWHRRCTFTRIGWYRGIRGNPGLRCCLNLPVLGDWSITRYAR